MSAYTPHQGGGGWAKPLPLDVTQSRSEGLCLDQIPKMPGFDIFDGTWIDDCLCLSGRAKSELLPWVLRVIYSREERSGRSSRRADHRQNFEQLVECVIANALRAHLFRSEPWVAFLRKHDSYWTRPKWFNAESLGKCVDLMEQAGMLSQIIGEVGRHSSVYCMTKDFSSMARAYGASEVISRRLPEKESLIILRASGEEKVDLRFQQTDETRLWAERLYEYNAFLEQHEVRLELTDREKRRFLDKVEERRSRHDRQPKVVEPEFFRRHLYRIFNDGTWEHGGRFYRGWWQQVPSDLRSKITINGRPTIELDYSGFLPRSIYHLNGIEYAPDDDPYSIPELEAYAERLSRPRDYFRKPIKKMLVALLNADKQDGHPELVRLDRSFKPGFNRRQVEGMIVNKHPFLAELFRSGQGKKNQRLDSEMAEKIIYGMMEVGVLVLPIHDSFIVDADFKQMLSDQMNGIYYDLVGYYPVIKMG